MTPVVIPTLAPTLDKSLKADRSLCHVRALQPSKDLRPRGEQRAGLCLFQERL